MRHRLALLAIIILFVGLSALECQVRLPPPPPTPLPTAGSLTPLPVPSSAPPPKATAAPAPAASAAEASAAAAPLAGKLTADQAKNHVGETAIVCGKVFGVHTSSQSKGFPTFANVGAPYPNQPFTILVWGEDLSKFSPKPASWDGKQVCATGQITSYRGKPEIVAKNPDQVTMNQK